ncbi:MAG TPA: hypothetical protein VKQ28_17025 [Candidatus Acidoferrum sp.]|nr:hypothetical protein [Candidatus Acidoferrum sp.]
MRLLLHATRYAAALLVFCSATIALARDKNVWSYEGGLFVITNGSLPSGPCFRLAGRVTSGDFFDHLKRFDKETGTVFRRGTEAVETFPDQLTLTFMVHDHYDQTCPPREEHPGAPKYLTREMMSTLHLYLYWKRGVELRPVENVERKYFGVRDLIPPAVAQAHGLPEKLEWAYEYIVPSAGVPLTDSLVLVLRDEENHMVARVAARL